MCGWSLGHFHCVTHSLIHITRGKKSVEHLHCVTHSLIHITRGKKSVEHQHSNINKHRYVTFSSFYVRFVRSRSAVSCGMTPSQRAVELRIKMHSHLRTRTFSTLLVRFLQTIVGEMHVYPCFVHKEQVRIVLVVCIWVLTCSDVVRSVEVDTILHRQSRLHFVRVCPVLCLHLDGSTNRARLISRTLERRSRIEAIDFGPRFARCACRNVCVTFASHPYLLC